MKNKVLSLMLLFAPWLAGAQNILAYRSVSELAHPELTWFTLDKTLALDFETYRAPVGSEEFRKVPALERTTSQGDTIFYHAMDTLLPATGLFQYYIIVKRSTGEPSYSEIMFGHNMGALPSPRIIAFTAASAADRKAIKLEWALNYSFTVKSLVLFRSRNHETGFEMIAILPPEATSYSDIVTTSNEPYFYFIQIRDFFGYQLPSVVIHGICTYAEKPYPPQNLTLLASDNSVRMSWTKVGENVIGYRVYRNFGESDRFVQVGQMIPADGNEGGFLDTAVTSPGITKGSYYVVTVSDGYLESTPSDTLSVQLPWNFIVSPPEEVDYVLDSTGFLRLFWTVPAETSGILGYNIFRDMNGSGFLQINESLVPAFQNSFLDESMKGYGSCRYAIETVSVSGKASENRTITRATRPEPYFHLVVSASVTDNNVELSWVDPKIPGMGKLAFYRNFAGGAPESRGSADISKQSWTDKGGALGGSYIYTVVAEYKDGSRILVNDGILVRKF